MSGAEQPFPQVPVVFFSSSSDAFAVRAIQTLNGLPADLPRWALIGGVAVAVNLDGFHRATGDLDAVSLAGEATLALLISRGALRSGTGVEFPTPGREPIKLDVIDVSEGDAQHAPFLAHRYALEAAAPRHIEVRDIRNTLLAETTVRVAEPGSIMAMKMHTVQARRAERPEKRSGDLYDMIRLVAAWGPIELATRLRSDSPPLLLKSTKRLCQEYFDSDAARSLHQLRIDSRGVVADVDRVDLELVAEFGRNL